MTLTPVIAAVMPRCKNPQGWASALEPALQKYGITDPDSVAAFLAQIAVESAEITRLEENLFYSVPRLMAVWPKRFPTEAAAEPYAMRPHTLANYVYANRMGNGPPESGDGWTYRGRGLKMVTGRANYAACGAALKIPLIECPDMLRMRTTAAESAAWFWASRPQGLDALADDRPDDDDDADFDAITKAINGGLTGRDLRRRYWLKAREALGLPV